MVRVAHFASFPLRSRAGIPSLPEKCRISGKISGRSLFCAHKQMTPGIVGNPVEDVVSKHLRATPEQGPNGSFMRGRLIFKDERFPRDHYRAQIFHLTAWIIAEAHMDGPLLHLVQMLQAFRNEGISMTVFLGLKLLHDLPDMAQPLRLVGFNVGELGSEAHCYNQRAEKMMIHCRYKTMGAREGLEIGRPYTECCRATIQAASALGTTVTVMQAVARSAFVPVPSVPV